MWCARTRLKRQRWQVAQIKGSVAFAETNDQLLSVDGTQISVSVFFKCDVCSSMQRWRRILPPEQEMKASDVKDLIMGPTGTLCTVQLKKVGDRGSVSRVIHQNANADADADADAADFVLAAPERDDADNDHGDVVTCF